MYVMLCRGISRLDVYAGMLVCVLCVVCVHVLVCMFVCALCVNASVGVYACVRGNVW